MPTFLNSHRIQQFRSARGVTQANLASHLNIPASTLSRIESARLDIDIATLESIAALLDCAPEELLVAPPEMLYSRPWLRAYADAPKKTVDQYMADARFAVEAIERLGLERLRDSLPLFHGDPNDDSEIEVYAREVREAAGIDSGVVPNSTRAAERLGCVVLPMDHELGRHLGMSTRINGIPVVRVSRPGDRLPGDRQRFTVSHELGHLGMHSLCPPPDSAEDSKRIERQAHRFASAFLLPGDEFLEDLHGVSRGRVTLSALVKLKARWGVSVKAMVVRVQQLGQIDADQARSLYKQISARGWNTSEPEHVGNEKAVWFSQALKRRFAETGRPFDLSGLGDSWFTAWSSWDPAEEATVLEFKPRTVAGANVLRLGGID